MGRSDSRITVTGDELVRLVKGRKFRKNLADAARITMRTGHESGFLVSRYIGRKKVNYVSPVQEGTTRGFAGPPTDWIYEQCPHWDPLVGYDLLGLHFHPEYAPLAISYNDILKTGNPLFRFDVRPIEAICAIGDDEQGYALLLQRTFTTLFESSKKVYDDFYQNCEDAVDLGIVDPKEFARYIALPGFIRCDILEFTLPKNHPFVKIRNVAIMRRFAYSLDADQTEWTSAYNRMCHRLVREDFTLRREPTSWKR